MDWYLTVAERRENLAGLAQWVFKDYATPLRSENPIPYINQKGLSDREGNKKEVYWIFKSHWTLIIPFAAYMAITGVSVQDRQASAAHQGLL